MLAAEADLKAELRICRALGAGARVNVDVLVEFNGWVCFVSGAKALLWLVEVGSSMGYGREYLSSVNPEYIAASKTTKHLVWQVLVRA